MKRIVTILVFTFLSTTTFGQVSKSNLGIREKELVIDSLIAHINQLYIFPDVSLKIESLLLKHKKMGTYTTILDHATFAKILTQELLAISNDKHFKVIGSKGLNIEDPAPNIEINPKKDFETSLHVQNYGIPHVEVLKGNIGYLKIDAFGPRKEVQNIIDAAMFFLNGTNAIVIDLKDCHGGDPELVQYLSSYFFGDNRVHLNDIYWRYKNITDSFWTQPIDKPKYSEKPIFIITSKKTFSAGEELAYDLKNMSKATLIGEKTGGGANPVQGIVLNENFSIFIPCGKAINPITHTNWEGTGVEPHIKFKGLNNLKSINKVVVKTLLEITKDEYLKGLYKETMLDLNK